MQEAALAFVLETCGLNVLVDCTVDPSVWVETLHPDGRSHVYGTISLDFGAKQEAVVSEATELLVLVCIDKVFKDFRAELTPPALLPVVCDEVGVVAAARRVLYKLIVFLEHSVAMLAGAAG